MTAVAASTFAPLEADCTLQVHMSWFLLQSKCMQIICMPDTSHQCLRSLFYAAINSQSVCTSVGGVYSASTCQLLQQPVCSRAGGEWLPQKRASLEGGMDLLSVGLLQVSPMLANINSKPILADTM